MMATHVALLRQAPSARCVTAYHHQLKSGLQRCLVWHGKIEELLQRIQRPARLRCVRIAQAQKRDAQARVERAAAGHSGLSGRGGASSAASHLRCGA